eukprot:3071134-Pleurochrysis_carterae.AAC.1
MKRVRASAHMLVQVRQRIIGSTCARLRAAAEVDTMRSRRFGRVRTSLDTREAARCLPTCACAWAWAWVHVRRHARARFVTPRSTSSRLATPRASRHSAC